MKKKKSELNLEPTVITQDTKTANSNHKVMILGTLLILTIVFSGYFFYQYQTNQNLLLNPTKAAQQEVTNLTKRVGKLIELPTKEVPTVATVSDIKKLSNQPFFTNAENGDKVLIYTQAKKAILYRPSKNIIIEVAPINLGNTNSAASQSPSGTVAGIQSEKVNPTITPLQVIIYNGTTTVGLAKVAQQQLETALQSQINIPDTENAQRKDYAKTEVIDLNGSHGAEAAQIAKLLNGEVISTLPDGEARPNSDILVIVGK